MAQSIHILHLEDDPLDAELVQARLVDNGLNCRITLVQAQEAFEAALDNRGIDIVLADFRLPGYDGLSALRVALERRPEIPFIFVSGTMGEEAAIEALTQGATDYVLKNNLLRLPSAVTRAVEEAGHRRERRRQSIANMARLRLMQFAATHSLDELLEEAINEAEKETDSLIGFYVFIDDDQQSVTLMNWSTRTKAQFCTALGKGLHYPIADAGVWADGFHQRRPVIHNDYLSLANRKELPKGHAMVVRELVVPVIRGDKVKALLGVGNKPTDYTQTDVEAMSLLADLIWEITERKQVQQRIALLSFALNGIHEATFIADESAYFRYVNDEACRLLEYTQDEFLTMTLSDVNPSFSLAHWPKHWSRLKTQGMLTFEAQLKNKDSRLIPVEVNANYFEYEGKGYDLGLVRDITERKREEARRKEQLHFLQQLIDAIPIPVYYKDRDGLYLGCNAAFDRSAGLTRKNIVGKTAHEVVPKEEADRHVAADAALLSQPGVQAYEVSRLLENGKHRDVIFHKATFVDIKKKVAGTVGALVDITERKAAERQRLANLWFFESMDRTNLAIQGADDLETMMKDVLDVVLSIFGCDRAFLMYPCDPESRTWTCPMERNKPEYPGVWKLKLEIPMSPPVSETLRVLLATDGPVVFGPGTSHALPEDISEQFSIKSFMSMAIYPKTGSPWQFGIHQCANAIVWTAEQMRLFEAIGRRLADSLTSLMSYRELRKNEEFLDNIVEHIPNMIFVKDAQNLRFIRFNKAGEELLGYHREELIGKTDYDFFPKAEADFFIAKDRQVLNSKELVDIPEEAIRSRSHGPRMLHTKKIPILDEAGKPQFLLGISEDITERKQAEASIRKLSQAIEQSPVSIVITDTKGNIEFVNAKFTQITGYTFAEALGRNPRILKSGETPAEEYRRLWQTIGMGEVWKGEFRNRKKNGELFWEQATISPVRDVDGAITHYVAVKEDITERKKLEDQLRQVHKMEAIGQLAGGIAHDFNNILSAITGYTELSISILEGQSTVYDYLSHVLEAGARAKELIKQILMFSRETSQEVRPIQVVFPVKEALNLIRASVPATIEIRSKLLSNASALADPTQVHQIVMNLCTNAAHAMREKGGLLEVHLTDITIDHGDARKDYPDAKPGDYIHLAVSDQGYGIDEHFLHRIFDPFFTTKEMGEGTGMGLSVVHGIVKSYDGYIYVHSRLGEGSRFDILIPAQKSKMAQDTLRDLPIPTGSESILFVDDETMIVDIVKQMLESLGYHVTARTSAVEAWEAFRNKPDFFDLVVTDMAMPKLSGLDLAEKIHRIRPELPMVLCSGFNLDMHEAKLAEHGFEDIVHKPILRRDMAIAIRKALDRRRLSKDSDDSK